MSSPGPLPPGFAAGFAKLLAPGELGAAGAVIAEAARLDEEVLADFLAALAGRVEVSAEPLTAGELRALLQAASRRRPSRSSASRRSSK